MFTDDFLSQQLFFRQFAVGFQHHGDGLDQVGSRFFQRRALRVCARQFFDKRRIALGKLLEDRRKPQFHKIRLPDIHELSSAVSFSPIAVLHP